jgi:hypothetical protein
MPEREAMTSLADYGADIDSRPLGMAHRLCAGQTRRR